MSSEDLICLKLNNEKLIKTNRKLNEMLKLMEKFRVLLIAMVNNCKCNTESNIRIKFNLLMEDFYDFNDKSSVNCNDDQKFDNFNETNIKLNVSQNDVNCSQIDISSVVNNLLTNQPLIQTEDNVSIASNLIKTLIVTLFQNNFIDLKSDNKLDPLVNEMVADIVDDTIENKRRKQKQRLFDSMTKTVDGKELDLRERVARLKRYVARPKIYSRVNKPRVRTDQSFECSWPGCEAIFKVCL